MIMLFLVMSSLPVRASELTACQKQIVREIVATQSRSFRGESPQVSVHEPLGSPADAQYMNVVMDVHFKQRTFLVGYHEYDGLCAFRSMTYVPPEELLEHDPEKCLEFARHSIQSLSGYREIYFSRTSDRDPKGEYSFKVKLSDRAEGSLTLSRKTCDIVSFYVPFRSVSMKGDK